MYASVVTFKRLDGSQLMKHILVLQQIWSTSVKYAAFCSPLGAEEGECRT